MSNGILKVTEVRKRIEQKRSHLLLGNGFSIGCDSIFSYGSLYDAIADTLPEKVRATFEHLGTNNFERAMRLLEEGAWITDLYNPDLKAADEMRERLDVVKSALIKAVAEKHLARPGDVQEWRLSTCVEFLKPFHNVFSLNYDLLLYWTEMHGLSVLQGRDGFRDSVDDPDAEYCVFSEHVRDEKGIFFIHGALHLYVEDGEVRKHTWTKSGKPLIELIQAGLQLNEYPLFVAEGDSLKKREQILANGYLDYCLGKLGRIKDPLVTF